MLSELRGLKAGEYYSKDKTLLLKVTRSDNGVSLEIADFDADIFYAVTVDENNKTKFEWGNVTPTSLDQNTGDSNGES